MSDGQKSGKSPGGRERSRLRGEGRAKSLFAAAAQAWAWLPAMLVLAETAGTGPLPRWLGVAAGTALLAAALAVVRHLPRWVVRFALFGAFVAVLAGAVFYANAALLLPVLFLGAVAWQSGRPPGWLGIGAAGVAVAAVVSIAARWAPELAAYRIFLVLAGVFWFVVLLAAGHSRQLDAAGLDQNIVTRAVSAANRKYLIGLIAVVLAVFLMTSGLSAWSAIAEYLNRLIPEGGSADPPPAPPPPMPAMPEGMFPEEGEPAPAWLRRLMDAAMYAIAGAAAAFLLWLLARHYLLDRSWYRSLLARLRKLWQWVFAERKPEGVPLYEEERESVLDIRKMLREVRLTRGRGGMRAGRLNREEWERLSPEDKVRRLYEDAVSTGIRAGFPFRPSRTPSETLDELEAWLAEAPPKASAAASGAGGLREWLGAGKRRLREAYEKARYGNAAPSEEELRAFADAYPWREKKR